MLDPNGEVFDPALAPTFELHQDISALAMRQTVCFLNLHQRLPAFRLYVASQG